MTASSSTLLSDVFPARLLPEPTLLAMPEEVPWPSEDDEEDEEDEGEDEEEEGEEPEWILLGGA